MTLSPQTIHSGKSKLLSAATGDWRLLRPLRLPEPSCPLPPAEPPKSIASSSVPTVLRRSPELDEEDEEVVDMMRLLPSPLPASEDVAEVAEVTKAPGYEARLGFNEGFGPSPPLGVFFSRRIFWWQRGA